jgi:hypothetical protein
VTHYGFDPDRRVVVATWPAGIGHAAATVADLPADVPDQTASHLAAALERFSGALWHSYTHPWLEDLVWAVAESGAAVGDVEPEGEPFAEVLPAVRTPNLPDDGGLVLVSDDAVVEYAHQIGRLLGGAGPGLLDQVEAELAAELSAVRHAELGDLGGRARQAVALSRAEASPLQVRAAHAALLHEPLGPEGLFVEIDPTAASVAAAHWLAQAATLAAEVSGGDPLGVIEEADDIEALPVLTPTVVLVRMLGGGETPRAVVLDLVRGALDAAAGRIPDLNALVLQIAEAETRADEVPEARRDEMREALLPDRVTPLDPTRASLDLLEDLLSGIRGCWLVFSEYREPEVEGAGDAAFDAARRALRSEFDTLLRARADVDTDRLL